MAALMPGLERRLKAAVTGDVLFDRFSRGRYATDASFYQMMPVGVVAPRNVAEAERAVALAREEGACVLPRGGGTSQCGQAVNDALVVDCSKYLNRILDLDVENRRCVVEPGIVLDDLNRALRPHGLWFPVDVSTASRATIGGMAGNNSCGGRSLRYGTMRDNVLSIDAVLADGAAAHFGPISEMQGLPEASRMRRLASGLLAIGAREAAEIDERFPKVQRRVGGYNLDALVPGGNDINLAHLLVGSEGTLAFSTRIELRLSPLLGARALGICHFGRFYEAMDAVQHLVKLGPIAVELVDSTMIGLARDIPLFRPTLEQIVRGEPHALLIVEFAEATPQENRRRLLLLDEAMGDLGFAWDRTGPHRGGVVTVLDPVLQAAVADLRTSGLNIMMSMKSEGKPVSFVEDCAVPLPHLAAYTARLTQLFDRHGTRGTWYAHAAEGCLHVRPVLNLRQEQDVRTMRAIAEEAFAMVRQYKGSHSGEHGDGILRSEFHEAMFGARLVSAFEEVKQRFDPKGLYNPGRIVNAPKFDDRRLFRYAPDYNVPEFKTALDWSAYPGAGGGLQGAVEMCNNNGACRRIAGGTMCPSYRVTRDERDVTRGRANSLRLAMSGQIGRDAFASDAMAETMKLCVSCKGCRRECPTGVDMARMKIEVLAARAARHGHSLHERLVGFLPRYAPLAARAPWLLNLRDNLPGAAGLSQALAGFSAGRSLPRWRADIFADRDSPAGPPGGREIVLFADTFNRYFERETLDAAMTVLTEAGYRVHVPKPADGRARPLCCGRTFLAIGRVDKAREELARLVAAYAPFVERGVPVIGLEPSCIFSFRDEAPDILAGEDMKRLATHSLLFEEFLDREAQAGSFRPPLAPVAQKALLHGHCHQKAFGALGAVERVLGLVPGLAVETVESSCCGMAGAFGYAAETIEMSFAMAELSLAPAVRAADSETIIVADGTSCRHQIHDTTKRHAVHVARVLAASIAAAQRSDAAAGRAPPMRTTRCTRDGEKFLGNREALSEPGNAGEI